MAARKGGGEEEETGPDTNAWMVTFSDLLTLMITFFVLLLSMSSMDDKSLQNIFGAFTEALGVLEMGSGGELRKEEIIDIEDTYQAFLLQKNVLKNILDAARRGDDGLALNSLRGTGSAVSVDGRGIVVTLSDAILFETGQTEIAEGAYPVINRLATYLKNSDFQIDVEGHADSIPAGAGSSNWLISAKRAVSVMRYLNKVSGIEMDRLSGRGYGEFSPLVDNSTVENRAKNRRIEIILSKRW